MKSNLKNYELTDQQNTESACEGCAFEQSECSHEAVAECSKDENINKVWTKIASAATKIKSATTKIAMILVALMLTSCAGMKAPVGKYWHRQNQNRIFQNYIQSSPPSKGTYSKTFAPKGDVMRRLYKHY